ncbi:MAG: hypothetical protein FJ293_13980 [Planctomycetes bacterium]|nr:hypothetical protein [Planctomycetota bacterium]
MAERDGFSEWISRFAADWRHGPWAVREVARRGGPELARLAGLRDDAAVEWERALFLDLEVGRHPRGGPCLFLAGTARIRGGELVVTQRLARAADGEAALLEELLAELADARELFTFSGKGFDLPMTKERAAAHGRVAAFPARHFDLHRMAGKLLKKKFGDQKLQTFERELLRYERVGDLPGSASPLAWHELSEQGGSALRNAVLRHNLLDVVALPALAAELAFRMESPQEPDERAHAADVELARGKDRAAIEAALELDPDSFRARLELSKRIEQEEGDLSAALRHAELALEVAPDHLADAARRRIAQLKRRMARAGWEET